MYMYPEALDAMQKVASDLFKQAKRVADVKVVADSETGTASVDWHAGYGAGDLKVTIHMPVRPATSRMTQSEFDRWAAYVFHEVGHPLDTSKQVWDEAVRTSRHALLNALEDVRMEKCQIERGIAANGKQVLGDLIGQLAGEAAVKGFDVNDPKNIGWTMAVLGRAANGYGVDAQAFRAGLDPNGPVASVLSWALEALAKCRSTKDCLDLADRIVKALPNKAPKKDKGKGEGKPGKGEGEGKPGQGQPGEKQGEKQGEQGEGQQAGDKPDEGKDMTGRQGGGTDWDKDVQPLNAFQVREVSLAPKPAADTIYGPMAQDHGVVLDLIRTAKKQKHTIPMGNAVDAGGIAREAAKATKQRALLARAMKALDDDSYEGGRNHGRFDRRAIARAAMGQQNVFGRRTVVDGYEADVQVLIDGSGSMGGSEIVSAATLALVIKQAAMQVGVACTAHMFVGRTLYEVCSGKRAAESRRFANMPGRCGGGTPLSVSLLRVAHMQAARAPGKRKILFIVSDGGCDKGYHVVGQVAKYIEDGLDIEVANLGIGMIQGVIRNEVLINETDEVCKAGLDQMTRLLEKGRRA